MQDFEILANNKDAEKNIFSYQGPSQNCDEISCLNSAILITDSDI